MIFLKKILVALIVVSLWLNVVNPAKAMDYSLVVPTSVQEEIKPEQMGPFLAGDKNNSIDRSQWGKRTYYDNSTPQITKDPNHRSRIVDLGQDLHIGANPQVAGGINDQNYKLGKDEKWLTLTKTVQVITIDYNARAYIGEIHPGEVVLIDILTGMIKAIAKCGNWAREIGAQFTLITCTGNPDTPDPCKDPVNFNAALTLISTSQPRTLEDGSTSITETWGNNCKTQLKEIITKPPVDKSCKVGSASTLINKYGLKKPVDALAYSQANLAAADWAKYGDAITKMINGIGAMATEIIIVHDNCNVAVGLKLIQQGGIPKWVYGLMVGLFVLGIFVGRWTKSDTPPSIITGVKAQNPGTGNITRIGQNGGTVYE